MKRYDYDTMNSCFYKKPGNYGYPTTVIDWVFKKYNKKHLKWKITNITGTGKRFKVTVRVTEPNLYNIEYKAFYRTVWNAYKKWGIDADYEAVGAQSLTTFNNYVKKSTIKSKTKTVTFLVVKTKNGWKIKTKNRKMVDLAVGYFWEAMDDANNDVSEAINEDYYGY